MKRIRKQPKNNLSPHYKFYFTRSSSNSISYQLYNYQVRQTVVDCRLENNRAAAVDPLTRLHPLEALLLLSLFVFVKRVH